MVIVDTSVWIEYLRGKRTADVDALESLVDEGRAALTGLVLAELLRGRRTPGERSKLEERLTGAEFIDMDRSTWRRAGMIGGDLDARGSGIPMTDVLIAAVAIEHDHELFTRDKHFERIPGLRLYNWEDKDA